MPVDHRAGSSTDRGHGDERFDVVIVGARATGAATAMLLARRGVKVLAVDRAAYGSDTLSTHALMRGAVEALDRWGVLEEVAQTSTPAIHHAQIRYGEQELTIDVCGEGRGPLYAPRRTVIDPILVDAARSSGAEVRFGVRFEGVVTDPSGRVRGIRVRNRHDRTSTIRSDLVIGADGLHSAVARAVAAPTTRRSSTSAASIMRYWTDVDLDLDRYHWLWGEGCGGGVIPTNDDTVVVFVGMPRTRFGSAVRSDLEGTYWRLLGRLDPERAETVRAGRPAGPIRSFPGAPGQFRRPYGPGWALVGDAGYFKDPYAAHGMTDAFRGAEMLADAVVGGELEHYERTRDRASLPLFEVLDRILTSSWSLSELPGLHMELSQAMRDETSIETVAA